MYWFVSRGSYFTVVNFSNSLLLFIPFFFFLTLIGHCHDICAYMKCFAYAGFLLQIPQGGKQINKQLVASEYSFPMDVWLIRRQILSSDISPSSLLLKVDWRMRRVQDSKIQRGKKEPDALAFPFWWKNCSFRGVRVFPQTHFLLWRQLE